MASVSIHHEFPFHGDEVWALIAEFGAIDKLLNPETVLEVKCDGNEVGSTRWITLQDGAVVEERIEYLDPAARRMIYSIVGESPLPVTEYLATAKVSESEEGRCSLDWQSTFVPKGDKTMAEKVMLGLYTFAIGRINSLLGEQ